MPDTRTDENWLAGVVSPPAGDRAGTTRRNPDDAPTLPSREQKGAQEETLDDLRQEPEDQPEPHHDEGRAGALSVVAHYVGMSREDRSARRARGNGRNWWMRWMGEQPSSVEAHLYYFLHERFKRRDGRKGWDLNTNSPALNWLFATFIYRAYGLTIGLLFGCLLPYAFAWAHQRPGRGLLAFALSTVVAWNVIGWLLARLSGTS
ncbi:hypothetical protein ABZ897_01070 [Nonomuraea sp. NPDC046802]|uniref:hypothetical protein n=1 Tax=Nonomuraea sp. NPDC046802 TaxID=3154919 RepID=UPI0033FBD16C